MASVPPYSWLPSLDLDPQPLLVAGRLLSSDKKQAKSHEHVDHAVVARFSGGTVGTKWSGLVLLYTLENKGLEN